MKKPVSGIAMGLITDTDGAKYAVLSDILGDEDHLGDMDFKVTGTRDGITATQMDIKVDGLSYEVLEEGSSSGSRRPHAHPRQDPGKQSPNLARRLQSPRYRA